jgi:CHAT domain-containing protein
VFSRLHFASHGKFRSDEPLGSGLLLAKDADNDGLLTVGELYSMQLDADLVTLSACETGLGKVANGDDVVGLTRGFLFAGSRSIVASLWSVDDRATATLMKAFYDNLATHPKREALRRAQASARQEFPHPFFWAAFQLTGRGD